MKRNEFANKLCDVLEDRISDLGEMMKTKKYDNQMLIEFWIGVERDVVKFLGDNCLEIKIRYPRRKK